MKLSILIPVYNKENTIKLCLESIVNQSYQDFEAIIVDDGSTDNSDKIIKIFVKNDKRLKLIKQENAGYGASMNRALREAKGDYIGIVEPDDFIHKDMYKILMAHSKNNDIVKSNYVNFSGKTWKTNEINILRNLEQKPRIYYVDPTIWSAIYDRRFLEKNHIDFLETKGASFQDISFQLKSFISEKNIYCVDKSLYYYRGDSDSSSKNSKQNIGAVKDEFDDVDKFIKNIKINEEAKNFIIARRFNSYWWNLNRLGYSDAKKFAKVVSGDYRKIKKDTTFTANFFKKKELPIPYELSFSIRHPAIFVAIRPFFRFKNWSLRKVSLFLSHKHHTTKIVTK